VAGDVPDWLRDAVSEFGEECRLKLAGPGEREAAIRTPLENLLRKAGNRMGLPAVFHDEVSDSERRVRPDYGVSIGGAITGYVEVKAPGHTVDPSQFTGHDKLQWERQRDLPNLIYTNGTHWLLYRDGELLAGPVVLQGGDLAKAGKKLLAAPGLESLLANFLRWKPAPITSVAALVRAVAPLTRLLRGEVIDQLTAERKDIAAGADEYTQPFTGLARDWRAMLFPQASDDTFADGYAQAVTFALLLARTEGIDVAGKPLHEIGAALGHEHSLMGKALQLLTDDVAADFRVTLDLLVRVVGAVNWSRVRSGSRDTYLHLYENFLELYDNELRKKSGSYYTPREVVEQMVRLTEEALASHLGKSTGFRDADVLTVDPAMGTGTYLQTILEHVAREAAEKDGPGAVAGAVTQAAERLVGFELQMGPYAVAELRTADMLASHGATPPPGGIHLYVTDTLDDPHAVQSQMAYGLQLIAASRRRANAVKAKANVTVVIGNPPYKELAVGDGGWVEQGGREHHDAHARAILEDFYVAGAGRFKAKLKNLYIYFWRWATWKVWESTTTQPDGDAGIVCFISTSGYLAGQPFTGMREYMRRHASYGWIIDLTPEGQTPDIPTRIFPGVRQPLAIGLFVRTPDASDQFPATIRYRSVSGLQADKFAALAAIRLDDDGWREARSGWTEPLTPAATGGWDTYPALSDLMPWYSPGVFPTRTWVYAPNADTLRKRWKTLMAETDPEVQADMFKRTRDASMDKGKDPLPGSDTHRASSTSLRHDNVTKPQPIRVGYRSFDRQWVLPDGRLMDMPRPTLWAARLPGQVFLVEQHADVIHDGPGVVMSALIPDFHYFNGRGGRVLPYLHPDGTPNLAPRLTSVLSTLLGRDVTGADVLAYIAGIVAHPAYTETFADELTTPGIRVPFTADAGLWAEAVKLGEEVVWLHTYGAAFTGGDRPAANVRLPAGDDRQPLSTMAVTSMPESITYDAARSSLVVGDGEFAPVRPGVAEYTVGGRHVFKSWFDYRKKDPGGRRMSALDHMYPTSWDPDWTTEAIDLLTVLTRLVELEPAQADLLDRVVTGDLLAMDDLGKAGTRWPVSRDDRKPRFSINSLQLKDSHEGQRTLDD
jgi:hypothetical protein